MKAKDLRVESVEGLHKKLEDLNKELMSDRAQISSGTPPKNPGMMSQRRKIIARIKTILNEKHD